MLGGSAVLCVQVCIIDRVNTSAGGSAVLCVQVCIIDRVNTSAGRVCCVVCAGVYNRQG